MAISEFKATQWEQQHDKVFNDLLRLLDVATQKAHEDKPLEWGYTVEASIQGFSVKITIAPPPKVSGGGWGGKKDTGGEAQTPPKFDKQGIEAVVMANQDILNFKDEAGKLTISPKKFLGDLWPGINEDLKKYGMKWISSGKQSRWEGQP